MTLEELILDEIAVHGSLGFGRYLELALYHPDLGFYANSGAGRRRDFITSVEVGPLFGLLVGRAADRCWESLGAPSTFSFVDAGAGRGTLARSLLGSGPACAKALTYTAVEVSRAQRSDHPEGVHSEAELSRIGGDGIVFANELLDNLPFDLWECQAGRWFEIRVDIRAGALAEVRVESDRPAALAALAALDVAGDATVRVPDQAAARTWLTDALMVHDRGTVTVVDYAVPSYPVAPERRWLRTYDGHEHSGDPLQRPGSRDITVDVAIDQLSSVRAPDRVTTQADWLRGLGIEDLVEDGRRHWRDHAASPDLTAFAARSRIGEAAALLDPVGLGAFVVLEWDLGRAGPSARS